MFFRAYFTFQTFYILFVNTQQKKTRKQFKNQQTKSVRTFFFLNMLSFTQIFFGNTLSIIRLFRCKIIQIEKYQLTSVFPTSQSS